MTQNNANKSHLSVFLHFFLSHPLGVVNRLSFPTSVSGIEDPSSPSNSLWLKAWGRSHALRPLCGCVCPDRWGWRAVQFCRPLLLGHSWMDQGSLHGPSVALRGNVRQLDNIELRMETEPFCDCGWCRRRRPGGIGSYLPVKIRR